MAQRHWRIVLAVVMLAGLLMAVRPLTHRFEPETLFPQADKVAHVAFFVMLWLLALRAGFTSAWHLGLGLLGYGACIEIAQALLPTHRSASLTDVAADAAGIALAWWITRRAGSGSGRQPEEHRG
jgi:VanZ family protein